MKKSIHFLLSGFFNYCVKYHDLKQNIISVVGCFKKMNEKPKEQDFYTYKEFKQFIHYVDEEVYKQFFILMYFTGLRPGEAMALKFSDLNKHYIEVNKTIDSHGNREEGTPKTISSYRRVSIDKKLYKSLIKLRNGYDNKIKDSDCYIFGGIKPLSPTTINRRKKSACTKANIRSIKLHEFRHSHATLLLHRGVLIHEISKRLGHSKTSTTLDIYTHSNKVQEKRVTRTLSLIRLFTTF